MKAKPINKYMWRYVDWALLAIIVVIFGYGLLSLVNATASPFTGDESGFAEIYANLNLSTARWQLIFFGIGCAAMFFILLLDYHKIRPMTDYLYWLAVALLVLVLAFGSTQRGAQGWFVFGDGDTQRGFQPGEVCKVIIILALAKVFANKTEGHDEGITHIKDLWPALWRLAIPVALIMLQPDYGTAIVYVFIFLFMMFMAKTNWKLILLLIAVGLAVGLPLLWQNMDIYQQNRILAFLGLETVGTMTTEDLNLQVEQAKIAIGSGQMFGKGLFAAGSMSQLGYVPEQQNDFIFAVTVEAFGFVGGLALVLLYLALIVRTLILAMRAKDDFGCYIICGVAAMTIFHVVENIGMNLGLLPVTGIPLPLFSAGGSSLITNLIAFGMVLSVDMRRTKWITRR